jgi:3-isopropylmalate dehydrogenase
MKLNITTLPGDGIGPEVMAEAVKAVRAVADKFGHQVSFNEQLIGGIALRKCGLPLPDETVAACLSSDAVLLGAVGGPQYEKYPRGLKPEDGLLALRQKLGAFANLRPVIAYDQLLESSPLRADTIRGCNLLIVRELLGGLYFSSPRGFEGSTTGYYRAFNTMSYTVAEIERIARVAFDAAIARRRKVTSVDKANVLETSQLWRNVVSRVAKDYPQVELEHMLVDNCAMQLVARPRRFDVLLTENLFGDILSDEAAVIAGSIGMLASASLGGPVGLYEPVHGSAPDIAGTKQANPLGAIASAALMFRYSFKLEREARTIERAIERVLASNLRTPDLTPAHCARAGFATSSQIGDAVCRAIAEEGNSATSS